MAAPHAIYADGTLLQGSGPAVYVMEGGKRCWIPDPATFDASGYEWKSIQRISDGELNAIVQGASLYSVLPHQMDQHCGDGGLAVDGTHVYFRRRKPHSNYDDALYRRLRDGSGVAQMVDTNCGGRPAVDGNFVYFQGGGMRNALYRRPKDGSGSAQELDGNCGSGPTVDGNFVYFQGGPLRRSLYRRAKDGSGAAQQLDENCGSSPVIDGDFVYFVGGPGLTGLYRRRKDGAGGVQQLDENCGSSPVIDGDFVYFQGGPERRSLYRRRKDGSGGVQQLDDHCGGSPVVAGDFVYFQGGPERRSLYRRQKDGGDAAQLMDENCGSGLAVVGDQIYFQGGPGRNSLYLRSRRRRELPDRTGWMAASSAVIAGRPLWQVALPGSHDAGCYGRFWASAVDASSLVEQPRAQAQGASIGHQLAYGMRYFDLRFKAYPGGKYYVNHESDVTNITLDTVLADIRKFLANPVAAKEILVLEFRVAGAGVATEPASLEQEQAVLQKVVDACGKDRIVTTLDGKLPTRYTPQELWDAKKQVIILWDGRPEMFTWQRQHENNPATNARYIWTGDAGLSCEARFITTSTVVPSAYSVPQLLDARGPDLDWWRDNYKRVQKDSGARYWWRLGVHLTFNGTIETVLPTGAARSLPYVVHKLRTDWKKKPWNLVCADLFWREQYVDFVQAVIGLNGQYPYDAVDG